MRKFERVSNEEPSLPNPHLLRVDASKVRNYLLNLNHAEGQGKAKFFTAVGFSEENVDQFVDALRVHAAHNKIADVIAHAYGVKTVIDCFMPTPSGKPYCIRSVWNDHGDGEPPKLITAHPLGA